MPAPTKVILSLPPDSHPDSIRGTYLARDESLLGSMRSAMQSMYDVYDKVNTLGSTVRDKQRLAREALPHVERVTSSVGKAIEQLRKRREALDKQLDEKIIGDGRDPVGAEIRSLLQRMPKGNAAIKVADAARLGDRRTVAAALSAPAWVSGLDEQQRTTLRDVARKALEPDLHGLLGDLAANIERVERAHDVFMNRTAGLIRGWQSQDDALIAKALGGAA